MAQWRKVVVSGSTAELNNISASGDIVPITTDGSSLGSSTHNFSDLFLDSGAVVNFDSGDMTLTHAANEVQVDGGDLVIESTNKIGFGGAPSTDYIQKSTDVKIVAAADIILDPAGGQVSPASNDDAGLGEAGKAWSDLFLAEGGVINWDSGDVTLTQTGNSLALAGGSLWVGDNNVSGSTASTGSFGYLNVFGDAVIAGNLTFGDADTDTVSFGADITSNILPDASDTYNLGSDSQRWNDLYLSGSISASGGNHSITSDDTIDIDADGALTIDGGSIAIGTDANVAVDFNSSTFDLDSSGAITVDGLSTLSVDVDGATNINTSVGNITVDSEAGSLVLDGHTGVDIDASNSGKVAIDGAGGIDIGVNADVAIDVDASTFDLDASSTVHLSGSSVTLDGSGVSIEGNASEVDITTTGTVDINSAAFDVDASAGLTMTSTTMAFDPSSTFDLDAAGAITIDGASITLGGDADTAFDIDTSTLDIDSSGAVTIDGATSLSVIGSGSATFGDDTEHLVYDGSGNVDFDSVALDIDSSGAITIDGTSTVSIDGADNMNFTITSGTGGEDLTIAQIGANDSSIFITAAGTGTDAISIDATAGDMLIAPNLINGKTLTIGPSSATQMVFTPHGTAASEKISLINTAGTADDAIKIDSVAGGLTLAAGNDSLHIDADGTDADALNIDSAGGIDVDAIAGLTITSTTMAFDPSSTFDLDAAGAITIDGSSITLGGDADTAFDIDTSTLDIDASDEITIDAGSSSGISLDASAASNFTTSTGALTLAGVSLDVDATGGAFNIAATAASTVTTSGGALTLDGETGINIQENGTTIISVDDSRDIVVGNATNAETIRIGHSTSEVTVGDNLTVTGNLNVAGTETIVDSNVVNISDNIIQVNTGGAKRKGGLQVIDTDGDQTGSVVWDSDGNYFEVGLSGSEYRLPELATSTELSANNNKVLISDGARIDASATITDDGTTVDISNRVDAQASLQVTGSLYVSAGASVASSLASLVSFRNNGSTQLGYLASANTSAVTTGLIGYNASTGNLTVSSVIDGGSF